MAVALTATGAERMGMFYDHAAGQLVLMPVRRVVEQHETERQDHQQSKPFFKHDYSIEEYCSVTGKSNLRNSPCQYLKLGNYSNLTIKRAIPPGNCSSDTAYLLQF